MRKNAVRRWPGHPSATTVARSQRSYVTPGIPANAWSKRSAAIVRWTEWRSLCSVTKWGAPRHAREGVSIDQSNHRSGMAPIPGLRPGASPAVHRPRAASRNEHTREIGRDLPTHGEPRGRRANARWPRTCQGRAPGSCCGIGAFPVHRGGKPRAYVAEATPQTTGAGRQETTPSATPGSAAQ